MNDRMNRQLNTMKRLQQIGRDHPHLLDKPAANAAFAALTEAIARIEALDSRRLNGTSTFRSAVEEARNRRKLLRAALSDLSRVAKTLDRTAYPDIAAQLKMGRLNRNAELLALARAAITVVTPIKAVFIAHGAPDTVLADLQVLIDEFVASGDRRSRGIGVQIDCNTELVEAVRAGMRQVRILDGIMHFALKSSPGLMAAWTAARRIERRFRAADSSETNAELVSGSREDHDSPPPRIAPPPLVCAVRSEGVAAYPDDAGRLPDHAAPDADGGRSACAGKTRRS